MAAPSITRREDLSFTTTSDDPGIKSNWSVTHEGYWGDAVPIGKRYFAEVAELATANEQDALNAIVFAVTSAEWNHTNQGAGYGIEQGFTEELAAAALIGLRAIREGLLSNK